eukprot:SAG11_NODE_1001_length_6220_cov_6.550400_2_plen_48_part_00
MQDGQLLVTWSNLYYLMSAIVSKRLLAIVLRFVGASESRLITALIMS